MARLISTRSMVRGALIASFYVVITLVLSGVSFSAVQIRVAEALTVLPFFFPEAVWGVALGVALANLFSPFGVLDLLFGSLLSLAAALATYALGRFLRPHLDARGIIWLALVLAPLPPVLFNAFGVSGYLLGLGFVSGWTYWGLVLSILAGQAIACYGLGGPLLLTFSRRLKYVPKRKNHPR